MNAHTPYTLLTFAAALLVPLLPYAVNGAPLILDSWMHLNIAKETVTSGAYTLSEMGTRWPLVNLLLAFTILLTGLPPLYAGAVTPLLAGLATLPLYCLCRRLGLSTPAALTTILFLTFNPLYSYITFTGVIMKESTTYYLTLTMLLLATLITRNTNRRAPVIAATLIGTGITFGQHYASLVILLFLWALTGYHLLHKLKGDPAPLTALAVTLLIYTLIASAWNILNYLALGPYFPVFNPRDLTLLLAAFITLWAMHTMEKGPFSARYPWLPALAFFVALLGLRGSTYILSQPIEPISIWEVRNYVITGTFAISGLIIASKAPTVKAWAATALSLLIFAYIWGFTQPGYVLLIKSLHYYGVLLAIGTGFAAMTLMRKGILGKLVVASVLLFTLYASTAGTELSLNGLSAYHQGELTAASQLPAVTPGLILYGDGRTSALMSYVARLQVSEIQFYREPSPNTLLLLSKPNWKQGFLLDYDWVPTRSILTNADSWNRIWDSNYLKILQH